MVKPTLTKFIVFSLFVSIFIMSQEKPVRAQSTVEYATLIALQQSALFNSPTSKAASFKYQIVALDAQTKGKVTSDTRQVTLMMHITNNSSNSYKQVLVDPVTISLRTTSGATVNVTNPNSKTMPPLALTDVMEFSSSYVVLTPQPITLNIGQVSSNSLIAHVDLFLGLYNYIPTTVSTNVDGIVVSRVEDIIYEPSNNDLIPTVVNNQDAQLNTLANIQRTVSGVGSEVNEVANVNVNIANVQNSLLNAINRSQQATASTLTSIQQMLMSMIVHISQIK